MRTVHRALLIPLILLASFTTTAADKPAAKKEASFGVGKGSGAYLTKEQLRACFARQDKVKADDAELKAEQEANTAQKNDLARVGEDLKHQLQTVDRTQAEAVAAYNEAVQARDRQIDAYQARANAFNTRVEANHAAHGEFAQNCSSRRYFEEDEAAIRKGR